MPRSGEPWIPTSTPARRFDPEPQVPLAPAAAGSYCGPGGRWREHSGQERRPSRPGRGQSALPRGSLYNLSPEACRQSREPGGGGAGGVD